MANDYGKRVCLECGKEYEATYPAQVTCAKECHKARRRRLDAIWQRTARKSLWEKNRELKEKVAALEEKVTLGVQLLQERNGRIAELEKRLEDTQIALMAAEERIKALNAAEEQRPVQEQTEPSDKDMEAAKKAVKAGFKPEMQFCERMIVKAINLPCGKHEVCFNKPRCKRVPAGLVRPMNM